MIVVYVVVEEVELTGENSKNGNREREECSVFCVRNKRRRRIRSVGEMKPPLILNGQE
jgi:hypothetical protein